MWIWGCISRRGDIESCTGDTSTSALALHGLAHHPDLLGDCSWISSWITIVARRWRSFSSFCHSCEALYVCVYHFRSNYSLIWKVARCWSSRFSFGYSCDVLYLCVCHQLLVDPDFCAAPAPMYMMPYIIGHFLQKNPIICFSFERCYRLAVLFNVLPFL